MDIFIVALRLIHIVAGVFWAGAAFMLVSFILPTAKAAGPASAPYMQRLLESNFTRAVLGAGTLTVLAGLLMYWRDSGGLQPAWIATPTGLTLTLGGLFGIAALIYAGAVTAPTARKLAQLGHEIQAGGKPPTPAQLAQVGALQAKLGLTARVTAGLLGITVVAMAIARYV